VGANFNSTGVLLVASLAEPTVIINSFVNASFSYENIIENNKAGLISMAYNSVIDVSVTNLDQGTFSPAYRAYTFGQIYGCRSCRLSITNTRLFAGDGSCYIRKMTDSTFRDITFNGHLYSNSMTDGLGLALRVESTIIERLAVTVHLHISTDDEGATSAISALFTTVGSGLRIKRGALIIHGYGSYGGNGNGGNGIGLIIGNYRGSANPMAWGHGAGTVNSCPSKKQLLVVAVAHGNLTGVSLFGDQTWDNVSLSRLACAAYLTNVPFFQNTISGLQGFTDSGLIDRFFNYTGLLPQDVETYRLNLTTSLGLDPTKFVANVDFTTGNATAIWPDAGFLIPV